MELDAEVIQKFLERSMVSRWDAIHSMLFSDKSCGLLEIWDYGTYHTGNKILLTYELDKSVPYGEIHTVVRDERNLDDGKCQEVLYDMGQPYRCRLRRNHRGFHIDKNGYRSWD